MAKARITASKYRIASPPYPATSTRPITGLGLVRFLSSNVRTIPIVSGGQAIVASSAAGVLAASLWPPKGAGRSPSVPIRPGRGPAPDAEARGDRFYREPSGGAAGWTTQPTDIQVLGAEASPSALAGPPAG